MSELKTNIPENSTRKYPWLKVLITIAFIGLYGNGIAKTNVYFFAGQGSDERLFSGITLDSGFEMHFINYPLPPEHSSLASYSRLLMKQIDTSRPFVLIGVSMGGMISAELATLLHPEKVILISSAACASQLPMRYRFQQEFPLYKLIPGSLMKWGAQLLQPMVEPDRKLYADIFTSMLKSKSPTYYKRTVEMLINWDKQTRDSTIIQIHGSNDHTIPMKNITADYTVWNGSHMMTLTRSGEINTILHKILNPAF